MVFVTAEFNPNIVILSAGISFLGAYITICLCEQFRMCSTGENKPKILNKRGLLVMMATSLGGVGIWSMHFVGMSAMKLKTPDGEPIHIQFHLFSTIVSLLCVLLFAWLGLYISSMDIVFTKNKRQIVELFMSNSSSLSMKQVRNIHGSQIILLIGTKSVHHLCIGGLLAGAGVCVMHYLGMWAMDFQGNIVYNYGVVAASVLIAVIASTAAFWILFRLLSLYPHMEVMRVGSAVVMAIAVCGMHYTGMSAARFNYLEDRSQVSNAVTWMGTISGDSAFDGALVAAIVFVMILVILTLADLRAWLYTTHFQLQKADEILVGIHSSAFSPVIQNYLTKIHCRVSSHEAYESPHDTVHGGSTVRSRPPPRKNSRQSSGTVVPTDIETATQCTVGSLPNTADSAVLFADMLELKEVDEECSPHNSHHHPYEPLQRQSQHYTTAKMCEQKGGGDEL